MSTAADPVDKGSAVRFRILGAVELEVAGRPIDLGPPKRRLVAAALLIDLRQPLSIDTLIDRVWDERPPTEARTALYAHLARLRQAMAAAGQGDPAPPLLQRRSGGYFIAADDDRVDVHRFRSLSQRAAGADVAGEQRAALLREAIGLWRGSPLAGLNATWADGVRHGLQQQHAAVLVQWADAEVATGHPTEVVDELSEQVLRYPLQEPLAAALMRALLAAGQRTEAMECYRRSAHQLADALGVNPGPELRDLYTAILRADAAAAKGAAGAAVGSRTRPDYLPRPAQLPADVTAFSGRGGQLDELDRLLDGAAGQAATSVVISALAGTAGAGKTALALHWAHRVADRFPDGQLYVNLRGFDPAGPPMTPDDAIRGFLDAFGVPPRRMPQGRTAQVGLYRSLLAGRRVLVVLDNAHDAEQVRPLLPGSPSCFTLVTSRNRLAGLFVSDNAHPLSLDLLSEPEATQLLARRLGAQRVRDEATAVAAIVERCAGLPLALTIIAARAVLDPSLTLADLVRQLHDGRENLDVFGSEDPATDVRTVFSWSYQALSPAAARLLRLLGLHPGPDVSVASAASLAAHAPATVRALLVELVGAHLLTEQAGERYTQHDLLRAYAAERAQVDETATEREAAERRLLDHYLHSAVAAGRRVDACREPITLEPFAPGVVPERIDSDEQATAWLSAERAGLLAAIRRAGEAGQDRHVSGLTYAIRDFFERQGFWSDLAWAQEAAIAATARLGDHRDQARAHRGMALAHSRLRQYALAEEHLQHAMELSRTLGDTVSQAHASHNLARVVARQGRDEEALAHAERGLRLYREAGDSAGEGRALNAVGWYHGQLGHHDAALAHCQQALTVVRSLGDISGEADTWDSLGYARQQRGEYGEAVICYQHARELLQRLGDRYYEAGTLGRLGEARHALGQRTAALEAWGQALAILEDLGHPEADEMRARLGAGLR